MSCTWRATSGIAAANTRFVGQDENTHGAVPVEVERRCAFVREAGWGNAMRYNADG